MRSIGTRARSATILGHPHLVAHLRERVAQLGQRDHLHVAAGGLSVGGDEAHLRGRHLQRVEHPHLGRHDRLADGRAPLRRRRVRRPGRARACPPWRGCGRPRRTRPRPPRTPSRSSSSRTPGAPAARPRDGSARVASRSAGRIPAWTWHSPSHTCMRLPRTFSTYAPSHMSGPNRISVSGPWVS